MEQSLKDTGVSWLGEVPSDWSHKRLKFAVSLINEKMTTTDEELPYVGLEHVSSWTGRYFPSKETVSEGAASKFIQGDVLFGKLRPYLAKSFVAEDCGLASTELLVLRPSDEVTAKFLNFYMLSEGFVDIVDSSTYGAKMPRANWDFIGNLPMLIPSVSVQQKIVEFLEYKTSQIDALIGKKRALIEKLNEQRTAVITQAVTKGSDPDVPMKDSGVEWLGVIPAHWEVKRLKHISPKQGVGLVINPSHYVVDEGVPYIFGSNISEGQISTHNVRHMSVENSQLLSASLLHVGDLVTVRVGYPGVTAVVPPELNGANCASVMIIRRSESFVSQWLSYAMNSRLGRAQVEVVQYGAAQEQFNISHAVNFVFPVPPIDEQKMMIIYLKEPEFEVSEPEKYLLDWE